MSKTLTTRIVFAGVDNVSKTLGAITNKVNIAAGQMSKAGRGMQAAGMRSAFTITAPIVAAGKAGLDTAVQFEEATNAFKAVNQQLDDLPTAMKFAREEAFRLGKSTIFTPTEIMKAERALAMMGLSGEVRFDKLGNKISEVSAILEHATNLAAAGQIGIEDSADKLTNTVLGFHGKATTKDANGNSTGQVDLATFRQQTAEMADVIAATATSANTNVAEMMEAMKNAGPVARALQIPLTELAARLGIMADGGFRAGESGRAIRTGMLRLISPSKATIALLNGLGVKLQDFSNINKNFATQEGLSRNLEQLGLLNKVDANKMRDIFSRGLDGNDLLAALNTELTDGLDAASADVITDAISNYMLTGIDKIDFPALLDKVRAENNGFVPPRLFEKLFGKKQVAKFFGEGLDADALNNLRNTIIEKLEKSGKDGNYAKKMADVLMEGLPGAMKRLHAAYQGFQIQMTSAVSDELVASFDKLNKAFDWFLTNTSPATKKLLVFGALMAAVVGPALIYFGLAAQGLGALMGLLGTILTPLTLVARTFGLLAAGVAGSSLGFTALLALGAKLALIGGALYAAWNIFGDSLGEIGRVIKYGLMGAFQSLTRAAEWLFKGKPGTAKLFLDQALHRLGKTAQRVGEILRDNVIDAVKKFDALEGDDTTFLGGIIKGFGDLTPRIEGMKRALDDIKNGSGEYASAFEKIFSWFTNNGGDGYEVDNIFGRTLGDAAKLITDVSIATIEGVAGAFSGLGEALDGLFGGDFEKSGRGIVNVIDSIVTAAAQITDDLLIGLMVPPFIEATWNRLKDIITTIKDGLNSALHAIANPFGGSDAGNGVTSPDDEMNGLSAGVTNDNRETIGQLRQQTQAVENAKAQAELNVAATKDGSNAIVAAVNQNTAVLQAKQFKATVNGVGGVHSNFGADGKFKGRSNGESFVP